MRIHGPRQQVVRKSVLRATLPHPGGILNTAP